jgi:hypothetical protein
MPVRDDDESRELDSVIGINGVQNGGTGANLSAAAAGAVVMPTLGGSFTTTTGIGAYLSGTATSVLGRSANSTGALADIAASGNGEELRRVNGALAFADTVGMIATDHGVTGDGATDDHDSIDALCTTAAGNLIVFPEGEYLLEDATLEIREAVRWKATGATFLRPHGLLGIEIQPTGVSLGTPTTGSTSTTIAFAGTPFTANQYAGYWVEINTPRILRRKVLSNTTSTLTLDYALAQIPINVDITRSGATATAVLTNDPNYLSDETGGHGFITGDSVTISGADQAEYNGTFTVTKVDADTFTFTVAGTPASPATTTTEIIAMKPAALSAGAQTVTAYNTLDHVEIDGLTIDSSGSGGTGGTLVVRYAKNVTLNNLTNIESGRTAVALYSCEQVRVNGGKSVDSGVDSGASGGIGLLAINCEDVVVDGFSAIRSYGTYGIQLKDCRDGKIVNCYAEGGGHVGLNCKSSGLNPTWNCAIIGGSTRNNDEAGYKLHAMGNEGRTYNGERYAIYEAQSSSDAYGVYVYEEEGRTMVDTIVSGAQVEGAVATDIGGGSFVGGVGIILQGGSTTADGLIVRDCDRRGMDIGSGVTVRNARLINNNRGEINAEVRVVTSATGVRIEDTVFIHSEPGSLSSAAIAEQTSATGNYYRVRVSDTAGGYATAPISLASGSTSAIDWRTGVGSLGPTTVAAAVAATTLATITTAGLYRVSWSQVINRAATTSSSLQTTIGWNNGTAKTSTFWLDASGGTTGTAADTSNTLWSSRGNTFVIYCAASTTITVTIAYSSTGATTLRYIYTASAERVG